MSRINRNKWTAKDIGYIHAGGINNLFDNMIKVIFRVTDEEYDLLCQKMTDEEMNLLLVEDLTFAEKRQVINILNKYIDYETTIHPLRGS